MAPDDDDGYEFGPISFLSGYCDGTLPPTPPPPPFDPRAKVRAHAPMRPPTGPRAVGVRAKADRARTAESKARTAQSMRRIWAERRAATGK